MKYLIPDYLRLLKISLEYIRYYYKKYNKKLDSFECKYKLDYHIFNFTQITYAIQERFKNDYPKIWCETKKLFEKDELQPKTEIGVVTKFANKSKHEDSFDIIQNWSNLKLFPDGFYRPTKVDKIIKSKYNLYLRDKSLIEIFSNCYKNLKKYYDDLASSKSEP